MSESPVPSGSARPARLDIVSVAFVALLLISVHTRQGVHARASTLPHFDRRDLFRSPTSSAMCCRKLRIRSG